MDAFIVSVFVGLPAWNSYTSTCHELLVPDCFGSGCSPSWSQSVFLVLSHPRCVSCWSRRHASSNWVKINAERRSCLKSKAVQEHSQKKCWMLPLVRTFIFSSQPCVALGEDTNIKCSCSWNFCFLHWSQGFSVAFCICQEQLDPALLGFGARQTPKAHQTLYGFSFTPFSLYVFKKFYIDSRMRKHSRLHKIPLRIVVIDDWWAYSFPARS